MQWTWTHVQRQMKQRPRQTQNASFAQVRIAYCIISLHWLSAYKIVTIHTINNWNAPLYVRAIFLSLFLCFFDVCILVCSLNWMRCSFLFLLIHLDFLLFLAFFFARSQLFNRFFFVVVIHIDFINAIVTVCWIQFPFFFRTIQHKEYGFCFLISIHFSLYTGVFLLTHTKTCWNACINVCVYVWVCAHSCMFSISTKMFAIWARK